MAWTLDRAGTSSCSSRNGGDGATRDEAASTSTICWAADSTAAAPSSTPAHGQAAVTRPSGHRTDDVAPALVVPNSRPWPSYKATTLNGLSPAAPPAAPWPRAGTERRLGLHTRTGTARAARRGRTGASTDCWGLRHWRSAHLVCTNAAGCAKRPSSSSRSAPHRSARRGRGRRPMQHWAPATRRPTILEHADPQVLADYAATIRGTKLAHAAWPWPAAVLDLNRHAVLAEATTAVGSELHERDATAARPIRTGAMGRLRNCW